MHEAFYSEMKQLKDDLFAVEIPDNATAYILSSANGKEEGLFWKQPGVEAPPWVILSPGKWQFLFSYKLCTFDQAKSLVSFFEIAGEIGYRDYAYQVHRYSFMTPYESLASLLHSKKLIPQRNYAFICPLWECSACGLEITGYDKGFRIKSTNLPGSRYCSEQCLKVHAL